MAAIVLSFVLACVLLWAGVGFWLGRTVRPDVLAWVGIAAVPAFVLYFATRSDVSAPGIAVAAASWLAFVALLVVVRRRTARRVAEDGDMRMPS